ncbi:MAG: MFS transporter [Candidatus Bathyarchaeota archaeon]|nr:MFS transporter [Candidatus Bathyarchaeota archaeon]
MKVVSRIVVGFRGWGRNAKVLVATEPFWSIPMSWIFFYRPIFLRGAVGLTEVEIGILSSIYTAIAAIFPILGGYIADRFGRKNTFMILDSLTWLSALTLWLLTRDIVYALIAYIVESFTPIVYPIWECLLVEDTEPRYRSGIYAYVSTAYTVGMMSTPIAGYIITIYGVDLGCRILFTLAIISLSSMYIVRWIYLRETEIGYRLMKEKSLSSFRGYREILKAITRERVLLALMLLSIINSAYYSSTLYIPLYLVDSRGVGLATGEASILPFFSSMISLPLLLVIVPRISSKSGYTKALSVGYLSGLASTITLLTSKSIYGVITAGILLGLYSAIGYSVSRTFLTNEVESVDNRYRAKVLSVTTTLSSMINLATPATVGYIYSTHPKLFMIALSTIIFICLLISIALRIHIRRSR